MTYRKLLSLLVAALLVQLPASSQAKTANFAGTWNFNMTVTKDGCGLGQKGKKVPLNGIVITQKGKKASLTLQGVKFNARIAGKDLKGSGAYNYSGIKISGTIKGTLKGTKKMSVPSTKLTIKGGGKNCSLFFKGSGSKVG